MNEVKVSMIVSTYNGGEVISKMVDSLLSQTLDSYEIIIADDCSTDDTRQIISEYAEKYPQKVIPHFMEHNSRGSGTFNEAFKIAKGKYVAFLDQDDWCDSTMYEKLYEAAEREGAEIADCNCADVDSDGNIVCIEQSNTPDQIGETTKEKRKTLFLVPGRRLTKIIRKDFLSKYNIYHCDNVCFGDNYFMEIVMAYCQRISKVDEILYYYNVGNPSVTRSYNNPVLYDRVKSAELMLESLSGRGFLREYKEEIEYRFVELFYVNSLQVFLQQFKPCELNEIRYLRSVIRRDHRNYRKNKYFIERVSHKNKLLTCICDFSPWMLCEIWKLWVSLKS